ncbi:DUF6504 family protein [Kribbella sp.]|uniref:DUF6504 family protein n=1 Tax=Kribbella sp. TaxID=1871183 RepID=UPI002D66A0F2|nr:DUF6504 family protein [Kribbella sp.]HZX03564.1 DUF6504 family protein [Kribbella sp.]
MWEFDDAVEVHSVPVDGVQIPDQFLWRGRLWRVRAVRSQWTETAAWWERGVIGTGSSPDSLARIDAATVAAAVGVLDAEWGPERSVFRVEAGCGRFGRQEMFDLANDPLSGRWQLERVTDR